MPEISVPEALLLPLELPVLELSVPDAVLPLPELPVPDAVLLLWDVPALGTLALLLESFFPPQAKSVADITTHIKRAIFFFINFSPRLI